MTINNVDVFGMGDEPGKEDPMNMGHTEAKEAIVVEGGFDPETVNRDIWLLEEDQIRYQLVKARAAAAGFEACELIYMVGERDTDAISEDLFKQILRRIESGVRIFPADLRAAINAGKLVLRGENFRWLEATGADSATADELLELLQQHPGMHVLFPRMSAEVGFYRKIEKNMREIQFTSWSPEKVRYQVAKEATPDMTAAKFARLLKRATVDSNNPNKVVAQYGYAEVEFDLVNFKVDEYKVKRHLVSTQFGEMVHPMTALILMGTTLEKVSTQAAAEALLKAAAPSWFEVSDYGYAFWPAELRDSMTYTASVEGDLGFIVLKAKGAWDRVSLSDTRSARDVAKALEVLATTTSLPFAVKKQASGIKVGDGALAWLHDRQDNMVVTGNDASSAKKLLARGGLMGKGIAGTVDQSGDSTVIRAGLGIQKLDGNWMFEYGTPMGEVIVSNSTMGHGSGVSITKPGNVVRIRLQKTVRTSLSALDLPKVERKGKSFQTLREQIQEAVLKDLTVEHGFLHHGDPVIKYRGETIAWFKGHNMAAKVVGEPRLKIKPKSTSVSISVKVAVEFDYTMNKVTGPGLKATQIAMPVKLTDKDGNRMSQPDLLVTTEENKGDILIVYCWACSVAGDKDRALANGWMTQADYDLGFVAYNTQQGLSEEQQAAFRKYVDDNSVTFDLETKVNRSHYRLLESIEKAATEGTDTMTAEEYRDKFNYIPNKQLKADYGYTVRETGVQGVSFRNVPFGIELSTVLENLGRAAITGEQVVALNHLCEAVGKRIWDLGAEQREAVLSMMDVALGDVPDAEPIAREAALKHDRSLRGRALLEYYYEQYPNGVVIVNEEGVETYVKFDVLLQLGALMDGGAATGIALDVIRLLDWMHEDHKGTSGWDTQVTRLLGIVRSRARSWAADSKRVLGLVTRGRRNEMLSGKVKTTMSATIGSGMVGVSPLSPEVCTWLRMPEIKAYLKDNGIDASNPAELDGLLLPVYLLYSRSPMISVNGGYVLLTFEAEVGLYLVDGYEWAKGNEGDGDGDPIVLLVLTNYAIIQDVNLALYHSPFGPNGYAMAHGSNRALQPYAEFFTGNRKKLVHSTVHNVARVEYDKYLAHVNNEADHYSSFIGFTFGVCSYLTYKMGAMLDVAGYVPAGIEEANVFAWRRLYEGLGLAGVTPEALQMAEYIDRLGKYNRLVVSAETKRRLLNIADPDHAYTQDDFTSALLAGETVNYIVGSAAVRFIFSDGPVTLSKEGAIFMHRAILVVSLYRLLEKKAGGTESAMSEHVSPEAAISKLVHFQQDGILDDAIIYGTIRRGSQGFAVGSNGDISRAIFWHLTPAHIASLGNGIVAEIAKNVRAVQLSVAAIKQELDEEAERNMLGFDF